MFGDLRDPGQSALVVLSLSFAAKIYLSFYVRVRQALSGATSYDDYSKLDESSRVRFINASKAQLNVQEYEGIFLALLLFFYTQGIGGIHVEIVSVLLPVCQAIYFWGRALSGTGQPWIDLGTPPRFISMGIMIYVLSQNVGGQFGDLREPGQSAMAVLFFSLTAKMFMCSRRKFVIPSNPNDYQALEDTIKDKVANISKAQLNVAEYEGIFIAMLLFFHTQGVGGILVQIVSVALPLAQAIYFWGRTLSGKVQPWADLGTPPRFLSMGIMIYVLSKSVGGQFGDLRNPGQSAAILLLVSLSAKMFMCSHRKGVQKICDTADKEKNASTAQLNIAEYEGVFLAMLLFFHTQSLDGFMVQIVSVIIPLAQAVYFWGRALSGKPIPWQPLGVMPRYLAMGIMIHLLKAAVAK